MFKDKNLRKWLFGNYCSFGKGKWATMTISNRVDNRPDWKIRTDEGYLCSLLKRIEDCETEITELKKKK